MFPRNIRAKGLHEGIVTPEEFDRVAAILHEHDTVGYVDPEKVANPLMGLIKCGLCGYAMSRRPNATGVFYVCRNPACHCSSAYQDLVVRLVLTQLRDTVARYDGDAPAPPPAPAAPDHSREIALAQAAIDTARKQITTAQEMLERGVYSIDEYLDRRSVLQSKINSAQDEIDRARAQEKPDQSAAVLHNLPQIHHVLDAWPFATTPKQQNALLRSILSRIDYTKTTRCQRNESAADHITLSLSFLDTHESE